MRVPKIVVRTDSRPFTELDGRKRSQEHQVRGEFVKMLPNGACVFKITEVIYERNLPETFEPSLHSVGGEFGFSIKFLDMLVANGRVKVEKWTNV